MQAKPTTESEGIFQRYLEKHKFQWTRVESADGKHPDYSIECMGKICLFEVKEFDDPLKKPTGGFSPCPAIREKITQARKQFKRYRNHCCVLVLWNSKSVYRSALPDAVASAAFGEFILMDRLAAANLRSEPQSFQFMGSAELTPSHNTTISAIAILTPYRLNHLWLDVWRELDARQKRGEAIDVRDQFDLLQQFSEKTPNRFSHEGTIRVVAIENPYARIPLPRELFVGPFDQRWRMDGGLLGVAFIGSELERLRQDGVPFIYL